MLIDLAKLGIGGGVGALAGIGIVSWVRPTTTAGAGLLVVISVITCMTISQIIVQIAKRRAHGRAQRRQSPVPPRR